MVEGVQQGPALVGSHTYSETHAAEGNSGSIGSSSICVRTLRSVSLTGNVFSSHWSTSAHVEQVFTICFTCFCKNFLLQERFSSEHLVGTSTWDRPVIKSDSANSSAHSGRFFGLNSGNSS